MGVEVVERDPGEAGDVDAGGLYAYDPASNSWGSRLNAPVLKFPAMAAVNGRAIPRAGRTIRGGAPSNAVSVYDPATGTWAPLPAMPTLRHSAAATGLTGCSM